MLELFVVVFDPSSRLVYDESATSVAVLQPLIEFGRSLEMPRHEDPLFDETVLDQTSGIYSARAATGEPGVDGVASALRKSSRSCMLTPLT